MDTTHPQDRVDGSCPYPLLRVYSFVQVYHGPMWTILSVLLDGGPRRMCLRGREEKKETSKGEGKG